MSEYGLSPLRRTYWATMALVELRSVMDRQRQELVLRRLLKCAPEHHLDHAEQAVAALAGGNLIPLMIMYHVPRAEALMLLHHAWSRPPWRTGLSGEAQQLVDMEAIHGAYSAVSAYLDRIGVP